MPDIRESVEKIFEEDINPSLAMHAGSATVKNVYKENGVVKVTIEFQGSCVGCDSSEGATLIGIQNYLREELGNEDLEVLKEN
jgi:Fe-S cluster biogenesis protein NfuA